MTSMASSASPTREAKRRKKSVLHSQAREFVCSVREYFEKEKDNGAPLLPVAQVVNRTATALKISKNTVVKIGKQQYNIDCDETGTTKLETPGKRRPRKKQVTGIDDFQKDAIRRHIYNYYRRKEHPTLPKLLVSLHKDSLFEGSKFSLRAVLKEIGFSYSVINGRKLLMERTDIVAWRCRFLRKMMKVNFADIVWLDETWVNANHSLNKGWSDGTPEGTMAVPVGKGGRIIVLHAGTSEGFVPNCLLMFRSKKTSDYHEEMNSTVFQKWFETSLMANLPKPSVIVMDNAPYHSVVHDKAPTLATRKDDIIEWLKRQDVEFSTDLKKAELLEIVAQKKPQFPTYVIDEIAKRHGHEVVRLPPYHCHFNAIEGVWAQIKQYVAANNKKFTISEVEKLLVEAVDRVTSETWTKIVNSTTGVIKEAAKNEGIVEDCFEKLIIRLGESSESSSTAEDSDSESSTDSDMSGVLPLL